MKSLTRSPRPQSQTPPSAHLASIEEYKKSIEAELEKICKDILEVLDHHLIKSAVSGESKVFYHKMCVMAPP